MSNPASMVALVVAAAAAWAATRLLSAWAPHLGLLDHPSLDRKFHAFSTPVVGGLAIAVGVACGWTLSPPTDLPLGAIISFAAILALGVADDRSDLSWKVRFPLQALAVLPMMLIDGVVIRDLGSIFGGGALLLGPLAIPVTIFMALGAINALNMVDGLDGLAGGAALTALVGIMIAASLSGSDLAGLLLVPVAAIAGFLLLNLRFPWQPRAKAFLGNGGSELLGLVLAWGVIRLTQDAGAVLPPVLAPYFVGPVLVDCVAVMLIRLMAGRSPFRADTGHFHHILRRAGLSVTAVVAIAVTATAAFAGAGVLAWRLGMSQTSLAISLVAVLAAYIAAQRALDAGVARIERKGPARPLVAK